MLEIRGITAEDAEVIATIHTQSWRDSYRGMLRDAYLDGDILTERLATWRSRMGEPHPGQMGFLAFRKTRPVGFVFAYPGAHQQWGTLLDNLHVVPDERGSGIGTQLLHEAAAHILKHHAGEGLFLWVFEQNTRARAYYERLGATPIERAEVTTPDGGRVMEWRYVWPNVGLLHELTRPQRFGSRRHVDG